MSCYDTQQRIENTANSARRKPWRGRIGHEDHSFISKSSGLSVCSLLCALVTRLTNRIILFPGIISIPYPARDFNDFQAEPTRCTAAPLPCTPPCTSFAARLEVEYNALLVGAGRAAARWAWVCQQGIDRWSSECHLNIFFSHFDPGVEAGKERCVWLGH
jgi:hypothetical protein